MFPTGGVKKKDDKCRKEEDKAKECTGHIQHFHWYKCSIQQCLIFDTFLCYFSSFWPDKHFSYYCLYVFK